MADCGHMFDVMREASERGDTTYVNGGDGMAATLELIRKHEVQALRMLSRQSTGYHGQASQTRNCLMS